MPNIESAPPSSIDNPQQFVVAEQCFEVYRSNMPEFISQCLENQTGNYCSIQRIYLPPNLRSILYIQAQLDEAGDLTFHKVSATDSDHLHATEPIDQSTYQSWASTPEAELVEFDRLIIDWDGQTVFYDTYGDNPDAETTVTVQLTADNPTLRPWHNDPARSGWLSRLVDPSDLPRDDFYIYTTPHPIVAQPDTTQQLHLPNAA